MKRLSREVYSWCIMKIRNLKAEQTGQLIWENASMHLQWKQTGFSSPILIQKHFYLIFFAVLFILARTMACFKEFKFLPENWHFIIKVIHDLSAVAHFIRNMSPLVAQIAYHHTFQFSDLKVVMMEYFAFLIGRHKICFCASKVERKSI